MRVLYRIVRIHPRRGITIEPDPRHAEILIRDLDGESGRAVTTPMTKDNAKESVESITRGGLRESKEQEGPETRQRTERSRQIGGCSGHEVPCTRGKTKLSPVTLPLVSKSWSVACPHHRDRTGKGFRGWRGTCDTSLDAYSGMHFKAHPARSLASLTATGPDAKEHVDPHPVDA